MQFADFALARRIEAFEAASARSCADALRLRNPDLRATWMDVAGGCATFTGIGSPLTQGVAVGMDGTVAKQDMDRIESFYFERGAAVEFETCPMAHASVFELLGNRNYRVTQFSNVLYRPVEPGETFPAAPVNISVRRAGADETPLWAETVARGFSEEIPFTAELVAILEAFSARPGAQLWLAECEGRIAGGAAMAVADGMAGLFGAATLAEFRGRGVQQAFFSARLAEASRRAATLAYTIAVPDSASHRNAERMGFRVAYTRLKFTRPAKG